MKLDLSVKIGELELRNPLILAAGPPGRVARGLIKYIDLGFAAVVTKTITREPWPGNPSPRDFVIGKQLLESSGIPNVGLKTMVEEVKKAKNVIKDRGYVISNIQGENPEEFTEMAREFEKGGADAIELAISGCSSYKPGTNIACSYWEKTPERIFEVVKAVKESVEIPVIVKTQILDFDRIKTIEKAGADAIHKGTSVGIGLPIDINTGKPLLGNPRGTCAVYSPACKFVGLRNVAGLARVVKIPIIGSGGIWSGKDVIEYVMVGATAVQLLTSVMLTGPKLVKIILKDIEEYMSQKNYDKLDKIKGVSLKYLPSEPYLPSDCAGTSSHL